MWLYKLFINYINNSKNAIRNNKIVCRNNPQLRYVKNVQHTSINFTKRNVPFTNRLLIKPLYDKSHNIIHIMCITYNRVDDMPHTDTIILSQKLLEIKQELEWLPYAISLTTPMWPFLIQHVNNKWCELTGYSVHEMVGNTFINIQGSSAFYKNDALLLQQKMASILA